MRVATIPLQVTMTTAIQRAQADLAVTQQRIASGKQAQNYANLGSLAPRVLSAHSMLARADAHKAVGEQVSTTLSIYDASFTTIDSAADNLRQTLLQAVGTGQTTGVQAVIDGAFHTYRNSLNVTERGVALFGGAQTEGTPFAIDQLPNLVGTTPATVFTNDQVKAQAEVAEGQQIQYGQLASDVGSDLYLAFRSLAEAGTFGTTPTPAQSAKINEALTYLGSGLTQLRTAQADNGLRIQQIDTLTTRAQDRGQLWQDIVSKNEDADLAQVAIDLTRQQMVLQASYSIFAKLSKLSLNDYL